MKRFSLVLALAVLLSSATSLFAASGPAGLTGIGVYGSLGSTAGTLGGGVGLSLKWGSFPVVGLKYDFNASRFNASLDYYVIDAEGLASNLSYFLGVGAYAGIAGGSNGGNAAFDMGLRMPIGLQFWPVKKFELFFAPVIAVPLYPSPSFGFGAEFGARVRF
ncbi:MAG: hypothetical protein ACOZCE_10160 [Spirochaetota bacterium]|jgi:hypothetical protein